VESRQYDTDVAVIGGGPAGAAAAISCAERGLRVRVFERDAAGAERPGETLHPGVEPVLAQLGIDGRRLAAVSGARHEGVWVDWNHTRRFKRFGGDMHESWRGFQVDRPAFDAMLLERAGELGVTVRHRCGRARILMHDGAVCGVTTKEGPVAARMVVDASGRAQWLCRQLQIDRPARSPRLLARYGYVNGACAERDAAPQITGGPSGWLWTAMIRPGTYQWTRVSLDGSKVSADWLPAELRGLTPKCASRGADVTWSMARETAGAGWFMVGDAASVLDPSSSHGVLKALLSGVMAAHLIAAILGRGACAAETAGAYHDWLTGWFENDVQQLARFYAELGFEGAAQEAAI
jgi:flavin-dependent dehydrogenase